MKFYATIEPYNYIIILPIAREEVGGLVPKIMFDFESAMMYTTNIVFMDLRVMDVMFVISLTPKPFPWPRSRVNFSSLFSLDLIFLALINRLLALMTVCCSILDFFGQVIWQSSLLLDMICWNLVSLPTSYDRRSVLCCVCLKRNDPGSFRCPIWSFYLKDVKIRLFGDERFLKYCSMTFYSPDIVIQEIIFYRGTYDLDKLTRKLLSELSLYVHWSPVQTRITVLHLKMELESKAFFVGIFHW